jgi:DNA replication and repair protein RecF
MLKWISLRDFRCFTGVELELHPQTTVLRGQNAQGKTSLIEAMCALLRLQSPRTSTRHEMIRHEARTAVIEGELNGLTLRHAFTATQRRLAVDGAVCGRSADFLRSTAAVVWMDHADMNLLRGGAESRRRYLDFTASQTCIGYLEALRRYDKALRSRNYLLKRDAQVNWRQADAYAEVMDQQAQFILAARLRVIQEALPHAVTALSSLSGGGELVDVSLEKGWSGESLLESLRSHREMEERTRTTAGGSHRDDLRLLVNQRDAASYASEGQQRSLSVALKIAQARLLEQEHECAPLMLIDDVFGELDASRRRRFLEQLPTGAQVVVTTTGGEWMDAVDGKQIYEVKEGEVGAGRVE